ncbi:hypothetical protein D3C86_1894500 [compost metagenome]
MFPHERVMSFLKVVDDIAIRPVMDNINLGGIHYGLGCDHLTHCLGKYDYPRDGRKNPRVDEGPESFYDSACLQIT